MGVTLPWHLGHLQNVHWMPADSSSRSGGDRCDDSVPTPTFAVLDHRAAPHPADLVSPTPDVTAGLSGGSEGTCPQKAVQTEPLEGLSPEQEWLVCGKGCISFPGVRGLESGKPPCGTGLGGELKCAEQAPSCKFEGSGQLLWETLLVLDARGSRNIPGTGCAIERHRMKPARTCTHTHSHRQEYTSHPGNPEEVADVPPSIPWLHSYHRTLAVPEVTHRGNRVKGVWGLSCVSTTTCGVMESACFQ